MHLKLTSDQSFVLRDENALFQCMGLMRTNDDELKRIFSTEITDYLKNQILVESPDVKDKSFKNDDSQPSHLQDSSQHRSHKRERPESLANLDERDFLTSDEQLNYCRRPTPSFMTNQGGNPSSLVGTSLSNHAAASTS